MPDSELAGRIQAAFVGRALETSGMIALRGDFENEEIAELLSGWIGAELPGSGLFVKTGDAMIGRMAPDELLFIVPFEELEEIAGFDQKSWQIGSDFGRRCFRYAGRVRGFRELDLAMSSPRARRWIFPAMPLVRDPFVERD